MGKRLLMVAAALVVVGASPILLARPASALIGPVESQTSFYRCHATVTVQQGFIIGTDFTRSASGSGVCLRDDNTQLLDRIELSGTWTRDEGTGLACPPFRYSFDQVRLSTSYFVNRTQEWREVTDRFTDLNVRDPSRQVFGVYDSASSSVPESFGIAQTDQDTCSTWTDISAPDFTTTADWTFPIGYPFNGPPPDSLLSLCVIGRLVPIPDTCIAI